MRSSIWKGKDRYYACLNVRLLNIINAICGMNVCRLEISNDASRVDTEQ